MVTKVQNEHKSPPKPFDEESGNSQRRRRAAPPWSFATAHTLYTILLLAILIFAATMGWIKSAFAIALGLLAGVISVFLSRKHEADVTRLTRQAGRLARDQERERARAQAPLRSKIIQGFVDPLMMIDANRTIVEANVAAKNLFGASIIGKDLFLVMRVPAALEAIRETMASGQPAEREFQYDKAVGRHFTLRAAMVVNELATLENDNGGETPFYVVLVFSDVTKVKLAEKMRADFVANASHELRTPLTSLIGFIETLQGPAKNDVEASQRFLSIMASEAQRMARVIDDLLSLSRIELDKHVSPTGVVKIGDLVNGVGRTLAVALEEDKRAYQVFVSDDLPAARGDRDQLIQVLQNLVSNAIKYGRSGTPISVRAHVLNANEMKIEVADEGDGIPAEHIPRLTERFYRIDTARSRQMGGTGLGLAIVKHIIERHRGRLQIESTPGKGTTISFTLPIAVEPAAAVPKTGAGVS